MVDAPSPRWPLDTAAVIGGSADAGVVLTASRDAGLIAVRGSGDDAEFMAAAESVFGHPLPLLPNTVRGSGSRRALWLGPDEWLARVPLSEVDDTVRRLTDALAVRHAAVVDVSDSRAVIRVAGPAAASCLAKGTTLDLHPRVFGPGRAAQSTLGRVSILIEQIDAAPTFEIVVGRSFAAYLWAWLVDAGLEFGLRGAPDS
jgi:sarcosine oxidase subunit gamma